MSVLVEAICVIVPRRVLDVSYPGGTEAFLSESAAREEVRYAIADDRLACVSVCTQEDMLATIDPLLSHGIVWGDEERRAVEIGCVDQEQGPMLESDWLEVERHPHGFTRAWTGSDDGSELVTPDQWRLTHSWNLVRTDIREGEDMLRLAAENGLETWLDLSTGEVTTGRAESPVVIAGDEKGADRVAMPALGRTLAAVRIVLRMREIPYQVDVEHGAVIVPFRTPAGARVELVIRAREDGGARCDAVLPFRIPATAVPNVRALADAVVTLPSAAVPGLAVWLDPATRTAALTSTLPPFSDDVGMKRLEAMIGAAADRADALREALVALRDGGDPSGTAVQLVRSAAMREAPEDHAAGGATWSTTADAPHPTPDPESPAPALLRVFRVALDARSWHYEVGPDGSWIRCRVQGRGGTCEYTIRIDERAERVIVMLQAPTRVPEAFRAAACEYLTRVNYLLPFGNVEMDLDDGEWSARVAVDVEGGMLTEPMAQTMLSTAGAIMDRWQEGMMRLVYGGLSARAAFERTLAASDSQPPIGRQEENA